MIEFVDLKHQYLRIRLNLEKRIRRIMNEAHFIMGPEIGELEDLLCRYTGRKYCLGCASGTDALLLALMANGIGRGDAVFTTPFTFFATAEVIALLGATPIFVDVEGATFNIDPDALIKSIVDLESGHPPTKSIAGTKRPRAIIAVDLFGLPADYPRLSRIAEEHDLLLIEDAAQSFGATTDSRKACSFGQIAATSFFPAKPLGCYGDGGALFTDDDVLAAKVRSLRIHGQGMDKYHNVTVGINGRLDTIQAAVLLEKLTIFDGELLDRRRIASVYRQELSSHYGLQGIPEGSSSAWAQFALLHEDRDRIIACLNKSGIPTAIYYPLPLHLQPAFAELGYEKGAFPIAEDLARRIFHIPFHPYLEARDQKAIIRALLDC